MSDAEILTHVREQSHALDEKVRKRDRREGLAAAFVFVAFGVMAVLVPSWLVRAGAALVMAGSVFIWWKLRRARTGEQRDGGDRTAAPRSVAEELRAERRKLDAQIGLLESVLWWYIAPIVAGGLLVTLGLGGAAWSTYAMVAAWVLLGGTIYQLNQRAVRRDLRPRREKLSRLLAQVEEP